MTSLPSGGANARRHAKLVGLLIRALQVVTVAYMVAALVVGPLHWFMLLSVPLALASVVLLELMRRLLGDLFARRGVPDGDARLGGYRRLYPWVLGLGVAQFAVYALLTTSIPAGEGGFNPAANLMFLVGWAASLVASYGTYIALLRSFQQPADGATRVQLREWLLRNVIASGVFYAMNAASSVQGDDALTGSRVLLSGLYVLMAVADVAWPWFTRLAVAQD